MVRCGQFAFLSVDFAHRLLYAFSEGERSGRGTCRRVGRFDHGPDRRLAPPPFCSHHQAARSSTDRPDCRHPQARLPPLRLHARPRLSASFGPDFLRLRHGPRLARPTDAPSHPPLDSPSLAPRVAKVPRLDRQVAHHLALPRGPLCARAGPGREQGGRGGELARGVGGPLQAVLERHLKLLAGGGRQVGRAAQGRRGCQERLEGKGGLEGRDCLLDRPARCVSLRWCPPAR